MLTKGQIDQFYRDVENLRLKFPVASITEATGMSKGNVSKYLSGKLSPSESFLQLFYEKFHIETVPREKENSNHKPIHKLTSSTSTPVFDMKPGSGKPSEHDITIESLNKVINGQKEIIMKLIDLLAINGIEKK